MNSRNESSFNGKNPFTSLNFISGGDYVTNGQQEQQQGELTKQIENIIEETSERESNVEDIETEQSTVIEADSMKTDEEMDMVEVKKPGRKTKRKRRVDSVIISDITAGSGRITRSKAKTESLSASDVEML